jgi:hypothetical protein
MIATAEAESVGEMANLLRKRGWKELNVSHQWRWRKNLPGQYTLRDAFELEMARVKGRKGTGKSNPLYR